MHKRKKKHRSRAHLGATVLEREAKIDLAERPADGLGIAFLGASETVTGSRYLVDDGETQVVIDSGLFQGPRDLRRLNWAPIPPEVADVDLVLLTHAHLDHSGALPRMARLGWDGTVLSTRATEALCELLLPDSGHLQEKDAEFANRHGFSRHQPALPLYTQADARMALQLFRTVEFGAWHAIADGIKARYHRAGHILGAASIEIDWNGRTILFSGDVGRYGDAVMKDPEPPERADYVVVESTYGDRRHEQVDPARVLGDHIERCVRRGGTVVIPAFAVGRAQSLLYHLSRLRADGRLRDIPIYLDSPMAINASGLMCDFMGGAPAESRGVRNCLWGGALCTGGRGVQGADRQCRPQGHHFGKRHGDRRPRSPSSQALRTRWEEPHPLFGVPGGGDTRRGDNRRGPDDQDPRRIYPGRGRGREPHHALGPR